MYDVDNIHEIVKENVGWDMPIQKLKFIYNNAQWQQVKPNADLVHNYNEISSRCIDGHAIQELACVSDYSFWTLMKTTKPTEDMYQFIHYHASTLKTEVDRDIIGPLKQVLSILDTHTTSALSDFILNFIDYGMMVVNFIGGFIGI